MKLVEGRIVHAGRRVEDVHDVSRIQAEALGREHPFGRGDDHRSGRSAWPLACVRQRQGAGCAAWFNMLKAMDDLLWSIEPKTSSDDRKRLMAMLPQLIAELQEGMMQGEWSSDRRDQFFSTLVDCHANAVKSGLKRPGRIIPF